MNVELEVDLKPSGKGTSTMIYAIDIDKFEKAMKDSGMDGGEGVDEEELKKSFEQLEEMGYSVEEYKEGSLSGVKGKKEFDDISEVLYDVKEGPESGLYSLEKEDGIYTFKGAVDGNVLMNDVLGESEFIPAEGVEVKSLMLDEGDEEQEVNIDDLNIEDIDDEIDITNFDFELDSDDDSEINEAEVLMGDTGEMEEMLRDAIQVKISINFPAEAIEHNATDVDGNTLTWDSTELEVSEDFYATFDADHFESQKDTQVSNDSSSLFDDSDLIIKSYIVLLILLLVSITLYGVKFVKK